MQNARSYIEARFNPPYFKISVEEFQQKLEVLLGLGLSDEALIILTKSAISGMIGVSDLELYESKLGQQAHDILLDMFYYPLRTRKEMEEIERGNHQDQTVRPEEEVSLPAPR